MNPQYIGQLALDLPASVYMDAGVFFPFFYREAPASFSIVRWLHDVNAICSHNHVHVTPRVLTEVRYAYTSIPTPKATRADVKRLTGKILEKVHVDPAIINCPTDSSLSMPDMSLLLRKDHGSPLLTADKALHARDRNSILLLWSASDMSLSLVR